MDSNVDVDGRIHRVKTERVPGELSFSALVDGKRYHISIQAADPEAREVTALVNNKPRRVTVLSESKNTMGLLLGSTRFDLRFTSGAIVTQKPLQVGKGKTSSYPNSITSQLPGRILSVKVGPDQRVVKGEVLLVIESMKMEATVNSPRDGVVKEVRVEPGKVVSKGEVLVIIN
jgi:biotin carboxyl carrier protein